jgi:hypothetical protein
MDPTEAVLAAARRTLAQAEGDVDLVRVQLRAIARDTAWRSRAADGFHAATDAAAAALDELRAALADDEQRLRDRLRGLAAQGGAG